MAELSDELPRPKRKKRDAIVGGKAGEPADEVRYWLTEIGAAKKREKDFRSEGRRIREIYAGEKKDAIPFNILFSNTETMVPALYSAVPRPVVQRRFKDEDPLGKAAANAAQKYLEFQVDTNLEGYETFDDSLKAAVLDAILPGRGVTTIKYDAEMGSDAGSPVKLSDTICTETGSWDRVYFGFARRWQDVPWICFEKYIDRKEAVRLFGEDVAARIVFTKGENPEGDDEQSTKDRDERETGERKTALLYQIWDKAGGKLVRWVSPQHTDGYLKVEDDPLKLSGFYNMPRPLKFVDKTDDLSPTALYSLYENQATELNSLTVRISRLVKAIKARGVYDGALGDEIGTLMESEDNALVPTDKASSLAGANGFDKAIWFMPLDVLTKTLSELYVARENVKNVIYEIIGIADILRGASQASETLGAQQIKTQWGTLRLRPKQAEVQRFARDILRMMVEIAAKQFSEDTWAKMTGLPYLTTAQVQQAQQMMQLAQTGDPRLAQQAQQASQLLQSTPTWAAVLELLRNDLQRAFKVDIETNSTIQPEAAEDQKNIADLLQALGSYLQQVGPMVLQGVLPFETAQSMLLAITRRFRFGNEVEDQIKQMKPPQPPQAEGDGGAAAKAQIDAQTKNAALQTENVQLKAQLAEMQRKADLAAQDTDLKLREHSLATDKELFRLEKQRADESIANKVSSEKERLNNEATKVDHKKQLVGIEQSNAKKDQQTAKEADSKVGAAVEKITKNFEQLTEVVGAHTQQIKEIAQIAKAPRRRKAIRDKDGRIVASEDEVIN